MSISLGSPRSGVAGQSTRSHSWTLFVSHPFWRAPPTPKKPAFPQSASSGSGVGASAAAALALALGAELAGAVAEAVGALDAVAVDEVRAVGAPVDALADAEAEPP